ncbi:Reticulon-domain-containing protein [Choanephora cucurbitarum]|nr:Reticulon-domain-containing protein [Choanephora cucurbitarum]
MADSQPTIADVTSPSDIRTQESSIPSAPLAPVVDEPVNQTASVANEPVTQAAPVVDEPVRQAAPIVEEPTKQTAPIVDEPVKQTVPVVSEPVKQTTTLDTPPVSEKPTLPAEIKKPSSTAAKKPFTYTSPNIKFEDNPSTYLKTSVESLIYWEYPKKSAITLAGSLAVLILTQYYSLLQILAGVFTLATGLNWVFVNTHKQGQKLISGKAPENVTNPHSQRLKTQGAYIPRDRVVHTAQLTVDVAELITQQLTKLVLIEDNWRSAISVVISYMVWTIAKFVSTKYIVAFFIISAFSLPRLYLQNQDVVDAHVAYQTKNARVLAEKYGGIANAKARELTGQATSFLKSKTASAQPKKTE